MNPPYPQLSVLESAVVAPSPTPPAPATSLPLTFFDVFWLNFPPVQRVFFYRLTSGPDAAADNSIATILSNLKTSLSQALRAFYPLAGRLRLTHGTADRYELHYQPGDGVTFTVAEYDGDVDDLAADGPREVAKILPLVPPLPDGGAVLALQATVLRGRRGLAIGMALHHADCDGASSTRFFHTWAAAGAGAGPPPPPPVIDRTLVKDPSGLYDVFVRAVPSTEEKEYVKMSDDQLLATFRLSKEDIQRVKDVVVDAAGEEGAAPPRCSSLVATFGFIWSCYQRAKDDDAESSGNRTYFRFPIDHRSRMKPDPVTDEYFGNCVGAALHGAPKAQLAGAGGLLAGCTAVATAMEQVVAGGIRSPELWGKRIMETIASGGGMLSVAGWPRFQVYHLDFGFGRPIKVEIVSVSRTGAMVVAENRRSSAGGGMEVGISLPPAGMRRFQKCFDDAIAWLHHHQTS